MSSLKVSNSSTPSKCCRTQSTHIVCSNSRSNHCNRRPLSNRLFTNLLSYFFSLDLSDIVEAELRQFSVPLPHCIFICLLGNDFGTAMHAKTTMSVGH